MLWLTAIPSLGVKVRDLFSLFEKKKLYRVSKRHFKYTLVVARVRYARSTDDVPPFFLSESCIPIMVVFDKKIKKKTQ